MSMYQIEPAPRTPLMSTSLKTAERLRLRNERLQKRILRVRAIVSKHQTWRLVAGSLFAIALVISAAQPHLKIAFPVTAVFFVVFTWLVVRTRRYSAFHETLLRLLAFNDRQAKRAGGMPSGRAHETATMQAREFPTLDYAQDLGLFGAHSLWTLLDETFTEDGGHELMATLAQEPGSTTQIRERQKLIQTLRTETWFYTRLTLLGSESDDFRLSSSQIKEILKQPPADKGFYRAYALSVLLWFAWAIGLVWFVTTGDGPVGWLFMAFALMHLGFVMRGGSGFKKAVGLSHHLELLEPVFTAVENKTKFSQTLRSQFPCTHQAGPSRQARRLARVLSFLGIETNPILHLVLNATFPWSSTGTVFLERIRRDLKNTFPECLKELAKFEALGSFLILDRYQTSQYPEIRDDDGRTPLQTLNLEAVFHPLIDRNRVVANDFHFPEGKTLGLLTGSNMSGKSTFLRTVGLNQWLANIGAPVFAEQMITRPLRLESCIEVSDSLRDGFSYFYSEVRRIKHVLKVAQTRGGVLFLIDEIFRGTNNRERQVGSRAVIRSLARASGSQGFISTHDLELATLEQTEPALMNLHFREEIRGSDMVFPYVLHHGPCPTTNALKIMEMEGIELYNEA